MINRTPILLLFAALFFIHCQHDAPAGGVKGPSGADKYQVPAIEGFVVRKQALSEEIVASGTILASEETALRPEAGGKVVSFHLPEGSLVKKGTLLLQIFDQDLQVQREKLLLEIEQAATTVSRLEELLKVKGVSKQEYDLANLQLQTLQRDLELLDINIRRTQVRAPYDGILGLRNISPGAYVSPADVITTIRSVDDLKIDFAIPEKYAPLVKPGQTVAFTIQGNKNVYKARIAATDQFVEADTRNIRVRARISEGKKDLIPGAFAQVKLDLNQKQASLLVPTQCLIPQAREKSVIVSRNGVAQFATVKTGIRQADLVEITEGLVEGDTVATTGILFLRPDMPLKFSKIQ